MPGLPQGEVEQISMMKPVAQGPHDTGLLEYLEDIIGTDKYKPQLEEGAKRCCLAPTPLPFLGGCIPKCINPGTNAQ